MEEIELEREMLMDMMSFTEGFDTKALQNDADYTALPSIGDKAHCTESQLDCCLFHPDIKLLDHKLLPIEEQLQHLLRKADELQNRLIYSKGIVEKQGFSDVVPRFLNTCEPYFTYLESAARNTASGQTALPMYIRTQLLQFSQQFCSQLEQLVLAYSSYGYVSLDEMDPMCVSHFYIGHCQLDNIKVSIFRYAQSTPFLAFSGIGLYKRMRWNVEQEKETEAGGIGKKDDDKIESTLVPEGEPEAKSVRRVEGNSTDYYFLCHEDVYSVDDALTDPTNRTGKEAVQRMWSIGKWVQIFPDPETEDINDWVLCTVPQGQYKPLVYLGEEEPSSCIATDCLLGMLLSQVESSTTHTNTYRDMSADQE